jgi:hypothetical protein
MSSPRIMHPQQKGSTSPTPTRFRDYPEKRPQAESIRKKSQVELVTLAYTVRVEKDYGSHAMVFDGQEFQKKMAGTGVYEVPTNNEITEFQVDVARAAKNKPEIAVYLSRYQKLQLSPFAYQSYGI